MKYILPILLLSACSSFVRVPIRLDLNVKRYDNSNRIVSNKRENVTLSMNRDMVSIFDKKYTVSKKVNTKYGFKGEAFDVEMNKYLIVYENNNHGLILLVASRNKGSFIVSTR